MNGLMWLILGPKLGLDQTMSMMMAMMGGRMNTNMLMMMMLMQPTATATASPYAATPTSGGVAGNLISALPLMVASGAFNQRRTTGRRFARTRGWRGGQSRRSTSYTVIR